MILITQKLEILYFSDNNFTDIIPESFCNLNIDFYGSNNWGVEYFNIWGNEICPPYPSCMDAEIVGEQDTSVCMAGCTDPIACNYVEEAFEEGSIITERPERVFLTEKEEEEYLL